MCGIVGVASSSPTFNRSWLSPASNSLAHRGPDDHGQWWSPCGRVGLAHRRLSIIDLSSNAIQPLHTECGKFSIVFNGEIYNYADLRSELKSSGFKFLTHSDTEVILAAYSIWGIDCLHRLRGMFAFSLYDSSKQQLFIARDRVGEKPLFYYSDSDNIYFASELKALLSNPSLPRTLDYSSFDQYLAFGSVSGSNCILNGYKKLLPAHFIVYDLKTSELNISRYWKLPDFSVSRDLSTTSDLLDGLDLLLGHSVQNCLTADVPIGVLLSGGLDSSLIAAYATRYSSNLRTFSIGFPGHQNLDESTHSSLIANYFGTDHTVLNAEPSSADLLPTLAKQFDEPMADSSMFPTWLVSNLVRKHCTVAIGGDGGDELFGGYSHYSRLLKFYNLSRYFPFELRKRFGSLVERLLPVGLPGRNYFQCLGIDFDQYLPPTVSLFDRSSRSSLFRELSTLSSRSEDIFFDNFSFHPDFIQRATRMDFHRYLPDDILVKVDRTSMLNSLELRSPFLDVEVVEFAFSSVPSFLKVSTSDKKILLKMLASRILPSNFDFSRKQGFSIPISSWLKSGPFRELFWDILLSSDCIFDRSTVKKLLHLQDLGFSNGERLFSLVLFELWRKSYSISF